MWTREYHVIIIDQYLNEVVMDASIPCYIMGLCPKPTNYHWMGIQVYNHFVILGSFN